MILLLPLSRFRIDYEVAIGRPYSGFEWTILQVVSRGECDIDALQKVTGVHPRLVVEALVTLARAGWLAVGAGDQPPFMLTADGQAAVGRQSAPSSLQVSQRYGLVVMERMTGLVVPNSEIRFASKRDLQEEKLWDSCTRLPTLVSDNDLSEAEVQHLLPRGQGEWLRWVGPISMLSKGTHWLPITLSTDSESLVGLPGSWTFRLQQLIMQHLAREGKTRRTVPKGEDQTELRVDADPLIAQEEQPGEFRTRIEPTDLLLSPAAHNAYLTKVLQEAATSLLITSAFVSRPALDRLQHGLLEAVKRGVNIDLLWGYDATPDALEFLRKLSFDTKRERGSLRFNAEPSNSHAKLVISDGPRGVEAVVGSYNWLSASQMPDAGVESMATEISVRVRHPGVVADLCRGAAALWGSAPSERLSSATDRWRRLSAEQGASAMQGSTESAGVGESNASIRVIYDRNHEHLLRTWYAAAERRFIVVSHRIGQIVETRLVSNAPAGRSRDFLYRALFGMKPDDADIQNRTEVIVKQGGGELVHRPGLHAKAVVADSAVCISSYNFLAADSFGTSRNGREIGLIMRGDEVANWLSSAILARK